VDRRWGKGKRKLLDTEFENDYRQDEVEEARQAFLAQEHESNRIGRSKTVLILLCSIPDWTIKIGFRGARHL